MADLKEILYVTGNPMKILHANTALNSFGYKVVGQKLDMIEPREEEPEKVVAEKVTQAFSQVKKPLIAEDSGIFIKALNGFPKTFVHFILDTIGIEGIIKLMAGLTDRAVEFRQALAYIEPGMTEPKIFSYTDGGFTLAKEIWPEPTDDPDEFDKILIPPGETKPLCTFSREWRAERDVKQNEGNIHYHQLALWLKNRK